jgi:hypothetical protein
MRGSDLKSILRWASFFYEVTESQTKYLNTIGSRELDGLMKSLGIEGIQANAYVGGEPFLWGPVFVMLPFGCCHRGYLRLSSGASSRTRALAAS